MQKKNVFVVGTDEFNHHKLNSLELARTHEFRPLLTFEETKAGGTYPLPKLMRKAERILDDFDGSIDAIIGFWDFPVTSMVPLLCRKYGLPSASVDSVLSCEHKYWSRHLQSQVIGDIPRCHAVNPWDEQALDKIQLPYPFWLKPVKSFSSHLAFLIDSEDEFNRALRIIRENIGFIAEPFNWFIDQARRDREFKQIDGWHCIAEEPIRGDQCTLEGYVIDGEVHTHGVIDSMTYPDSSVFHRYQYPSKLPESVKQRMIDDARKVLTRIGYDNQAYNIEFFYDRDEDRLRLLEINQRISQSHAEIFERVDGAPNHRVIAEVALGRRPNFPHGEGAYPMAAKCFLRRFENGRVRTAPGPNDLDRIRDEVPGVVVEIHAKEGTELSELIEQDAYSYVLAEIYLGGDSEEGILQDYARVVDMLQFEFEGSRQHHYMDVITAEQLDRRVGSQGVPPSSA